MIKFMVSLFVLVSCASATEEIPYKVMEKDGKMEIRKYDSYLTASVSFESEEELDKKGFRILADYIFGNNISMTSPVITEGEDIGMTAPVFTEGEDIGMTSPVFTEENEYVMTFVMPSRYELETLPKPKDERIIIKEVPSKMMAAVRFNGRRTQERNSRFEKDLRLWLSEKGMSIVGNALYAGYNPPWTLPVFRRNEVLFEVR